MDLFRSIIDYLTSGPVIALELLGENSIAKWQELAGPENSEQARLVAKSSLRACYGKDELHNAVYGSANAETAARVRILIIVNFRNFHCRAYVSVLHSVWYFQELQHFFPDSKSKSKGPKNTATLQDCTCCIIKPHVVQARFVGK